MNSYIESLKPDVITKLLAVNPQAKRNGSKFENLKCSECGRLGAFCNLDKGLNILCHHNNSCGITTPIKKLYPELFDKFSERFKPTKEDPKATARMYLQSRGIKTDSLEFEQGKRYDESTKKEYDTVKFKLAEGTFNERLIDYSEKNKCRSTGSFKGTVFKALSSAKPKETYIVESPIDALSLQQKGYDAIAIITCGTLPEKYYLDNNNIKYVIALDNDRAGHKGTAKHVEFFKKENIKFEIALSPKGLDWNDLLQRNRLDDRMIKECLWRGRLFQAETPLDYYKIYREKKGGYPKIFSFGTQIYRGYTRTRNNAEMPAVKRLTNCDIKMILTSKDDKNELSPELNHKVKITKPDSNEEKLGELSAEDLTGRTPFKRKLSAFDCFFFGDDNDLNYLAEYLIKQSRPTVRKVSGIGYDTKSGCYVYPSRLYDKKGVEHSINGDNYFKEFNLIPFGNDDIKNIEVSGREDIDIADVLRLIDGAYPNRGFAMISYMIATTFAHVIFPIWNHFSILNIYGASHKGKSEFAQMLFWMLSIDDDGITCDNSKIGSLRKLSQFRNIPVQINEADEKTLQYSGLNIKNLFHWRPLRITGQKDNTNKTKTLECSTGVIFNQNADIFTLPEQKNRTVSIYFSEDCVNDDTYSCYEKLSRYSARQFSFIGHFILSNRKYFEGLHQNLWVD